MAAKTDMERVGLFKELGYHSIGDPYKSPGNVIFNQAATKGRQMLPGGSKSMSALSGGYFAEFGRVFEKEAYSDAIKMRRQQRVKDLTKSIGKTWVPSHPPKDPAGLGNTYGTFAGKIDAFSPVQKPKSEYKTPGRNIVTSPLKKGTGFGYADVTLNKFPEFKGDRYNAVFDTVRKESELHKKAIAGRSGAFKSTCYGTSLFDPNVYKPVPGQKSGSRSAPAHRRDIKPFRPSHPSKKDGGCKAGTFDAFPKHTGGIYNNKKFKQPAEVVNNSGKKFIPNTGLKDVPNYSIMTKNVQLHVTSQNYRQIHSVMGY